MVLSDWNLTTLGEELERIEGGGTPSRKETTYWSGTIPWATVKDLTATRLDGTEEHISADGLRESSSRMIPMGTPIIATRMALGRVAVFSQDVAINQDLKALFPRATLDHEFLVQWLQANAPAIDALGSGSTVKGIRLETLRGLELLLPPLPEQRQIAAILGSVDEAIAATQAVIEQTRTVRQGLLRELLTRGIDHTRFRQTEIGKVPEGWEVRDLGSFLPRDATRNGLYKPADEYGEGTPIIRIDAFQNGETIGLSGLKRVRVSAQELELFAVEEGDVLLNRVNSLSHLGKVGIVGALSEPTVFESNMMCLRPPRESGMVPRFLLLLLASERGRAQVLGRAKQAIAQASINQQDVRSFTFAIPPAAEQNAIVEHVAAVERLEAENVAALAGTETLKRGLLQDLLTGRVRVGGG